MAVSVPPWRLIVPVKRLDRAKTRLAPLDGAVRARLALAFALDVVDAARSSPVVGWIGVTTADERVARALPTGVAVVPEGPAGGLNDAVATTVDLLGAGPVAVAPSDLPALTPATLTAALHSAARYDHAFVSDMDNLGTVLVAATVPPLRPMFGDGSAARHRAANLTELTGDWPGLRRDVDTSDHLRHAIELGLGAHTAAALTDVVLPAVD